MQLTNINGGNERLISTYNTKYTEYEKHISECEKKIELLNKEISVYQQKIKDIKKVAILHELDNFDDTAKADVYKRVLNKVVYYSESLKSGFIVITFKNGIEAIIITSGMKKRVVAQLPPSFKFNSEKRKGVVEVIDNASHGNYIDFQLPHYKEYTIKELKEEYPVEQWQI